MAPFLLSHPLSSEEPYSCGLCLEILKWLEKKSQLFIIAEAFPISLLGSDSVFKTILIMRTTTRHHLESNALKFALLSSAFTNNFWVGIFVQMLDVTVRNKTHTSIQNDGLNVFKAP